MKLCSFSLVAAAVAIAAPVAELKAHDSTEHSLEALRVAAMEETTLAFLATLDEAQRSVVMASLDDNATRTGWSNLPVGMAPRSGMAVADMSVEQRLAMHAMMAAAMSSQGYLEATTIMWHEDVLHEIFSAMIAGLPDDDPRKAGALAFKDNYDTEKFYVSVFGDPKGEDWGWTVTGHHYAANFTVSGGKIAFTPLFVGANPQIVPSGRYAGWRILQHEADRAFALLTSLEQEKLAQAVVSDVVDDEIFAGKGQQDRIGAPVGIRASDLDPAQRRLLSGLIDEYLGDASDEAAARQRLAIESDGDDALHFAWWGPTDDPAARFMFRVQGPSIVIDYVRESTPDGGYNHVHSIVRDPSNDYGADWLQRHYREAHQ